MKAFLMYRDRDFDPKQPLPANAEALARDLDLDGLFGAMALGDTFLADVARRAVLCSVDDPEAIRYRQQVLADCIEQPDIVRRIYAIAVDATEAERKAWGFWGRSPGLVLYRAVRVLELLVDPLKRLRKTADEAAGRFRSEGFVRFFAMLASELDDDYFRTIQEHLRELKFGRGVLISAQLGAANRGTNYVLRRPREQSWRERLVAVGHSGYSFQIADQDQSGAQALDELRDRGMNLVANALAQATDHIANFFRLLMAELGFYVGCLNLHARLREKGEPMCVPVPVAAHERALSARGLYDVCLSLRLQARAVGNDVDADGRSLVMITGANQGGKSTFLRSVGLAQLMMQAGMFVPAESLRASVSPGVFTHFKREEDASMQSGKLDEELSRMSTIADAITAGCLLLCNESFAATNEREGSEIARQVIRALMEAGVRVFFVTHLFDLAHGLYLHELDVARAGGPRTALFLRAERRPDGQRTFRLAEGEPLPTSYGEDSYARIFGAS
jgi:hypothetical protein